MRRSRPNTRRSVQRRRIGSEDTATGSLGIEIENIENTENTENIENIDITAATDPDRLIVVSVNITAGIARAHRPGGTQTPERSALHGCRPTLRLQNSHVPSVLARRRRRMLKRKHAYRVT